MANRNQRTANAILTSRVSKANQTALAARQIGRIVPKANYAELMQTVVAGINLIANNDFNPAIEKAITRQVMTTFENSDYNDKLQEFLAQNR